MIIIKSFSSVYDVMKKQIGSNRCLNKNTSEKALKAYLHLLATATLTNFKKILDSVRHYHINIKFKGCKGGIQRRKILDRINSAKDLHIEYDLEQANEELALEKHRQQLHEHREEIVSLQNRCYNLTNLLIAARRKKRLKVVVSERTLRRRKSILKNQMEQSTGNGFSVVKDQSPRKTSLKLDRANLSIRKYKSIKSSNQPSAIQIKAARALINDKSINITELLHALINKCTASNVRIKISVDGHDLCRGSAVAFSASLIDGSQVQDNIVLLKSVKGSETYETIKNSGYWKDIESQLIYSYNEKRVEYYFCADLKSILMSLGFKDANAKDVCPYCTCNKSRWHLCSNDDKWHPRFDCNLNLKPLEPSDPGFKRLPLIDVKKYRFVVIDTLHCYLRITDQLFTRTLNILTLKQKDKFVEECSHAGINKFRLLDKKMGGYKFSNLNVTERSKLIDCIFTKASVLKVIVPVADLTKIFNCYKDFKVLWATVKNNDITALKSTTQKFISSFRTTFVVAEIPNYIHLLTHLELLFNSFGDKFFSTARS